MLVLSEFAGVAERLDAAVLVNPYDVEGTAGAIAQALAMDAPERQRRMRVLRDRVDALPVARWAERCLEVPTIEGVGERRVASRRSNLVLLPVARD